MKLELTIKTSYLPEWGAYEGVRELLQNGKDAQVEFDATFEVKYRPDTKTLVIENEGCTLPHEALLLGHTTKQDRSSLIGKFGEGLKLGVLALIRAGHSVKIRSGSEVWVPSIQRSEKFDADVLVFNIDKGRAERDRVQIEVGGIEADAWEAMKDCFLFLLPTKTLTEVEIKTTNGSLLLGEKHAGRIYVKGIFVQRDVNLRYGYDFPDAEIDRDRRMLTKWDVNYRCQSIWKEALNKRPDLVEPFTQMLDQQSPDLDGLDDWSAKHLPEAVKAEVVRVFQERHGEGALPVTGLSESREVEHLGRKGVVAPKPLKAVLEAVLGTVEQIKQNLRHETAAIFSWGDLSDVEKLNLEFSVALITKVRSSVSLDDVNVVDFRDEAILGLHKDGQVQIAKKMLATRKEALLVLVHEFAHKISRETDGAKGHTEEVETLWADITEYLLTQQAN